MATSRSRAVRPPVGRELEECCTEAVFARSSSALEFVSRTPDGRSLLEREQALADRTGQPFAVVVGECEPAAPGRAEPRRIEIDALHALTVKSLRSSDHVLRSGDALVAVLPGTDLGGARCAFERTLAGSALASHLSLRAAEAAPAQHARRGRRVESGGPADRPPGPGIRWDERGVTVLLSRPLPRGKRLVDVVLASLGILVTLPLMVLIALGIKLTSRGPIFYRQTRTGRDFRRFRLAKFRTMRPRADVLVGELQHLNQMTGPLFKSDHDPRVNRFGKFLRRTSLDELPQLFNVLKGDMTLVGPRALSPMPSEYEPWQLRRFEVTPGIACSWQAFRRGETDFDEWMRSDLEYLDREPGPLEDLRLLVMTSVAVLRCAGGR